METERGDQRKFGVTRDSDTTTVSPCETVRARDWYNHHFEDYQAVKGRLSAVRNVVMNGPIDKAAQVLEKSCIYAGLSIQTHVNRHERAFTAYYSTDISIRAAATGTNYGNNKGDWLAYSLETFDFHQCVTTLRENGTIPALKFIESNFKGLSWTKAAFALCMCGIEELICPDTNVQKYLNVDGNGRFRIRTLNDYKEVRAKFNESVPLRDALSPFMNQWVVFDYIRGEHSDHMPFFTEALPALRY